jgi:hypothetical protein
LHDKNEIKQIFWKICVLFTNKMLKYWWLSLILNLCYMNQESQVYDGVGDGSYVYGSATIQKGNYGGGPFSNKHSDGDQPYF